MKTTLSLFILLPVLAYNCGGGSDGDDSSAQEEQSPTGGGDGGTGGNSGGGTSGGGTGGGGSSCLTDTQRTNIRNVLNRLTLLGVQEGILQIDSSDDTLDGSYLGSIAIEKISDSSWRESGGFCLNGTEVCIDIESDYTFKNGCFYQSDEQQEIRSTTANSFSASVLFTDETGERTRTIQGWTIHSSNRVKFNYDRYQNGQKNEDWEFTSF